MSRLEDANAAYPSCQFEKLLNTLFSLIQNAEPVLDLLHEIRQADRGVQASEDVKVTFHTVDAVKRAVRFSSRAACTTDSTRLLISKPKALLVDLVDSSESLQESHASSSSNGSGECRQDRVDRPTEKKRNDVIGGPENAPALGMLSPRKRNASVANPESADWDCIGNPGWLD
jgi:hypothetical protein